MMAHVDLCSGIGGFALGFQWAGLSKPVLFCDIELWSRQILRKHWPDVLIAEDVKELANDPDGLIPDCDILTAGYPCQPFSLAGERRGTEDDRHIWPEIFTIIKAKRPTWAVFENVYGHVSMGLDEVLSDLEGSSYAVRPFIVPACAVDAPHRRDRVWIIARNVGNTQHNGSPSPTLGRSTEEASDNNTEGQIKTGQSKGASQSGDCGSMEASPRADNVGNTFGSRQHGINRRQSEQKPQNGCEDVADTDSNERQFLCGQQSEQTQKALKRLGKRSRLQKQDVADTKRERLEGHSELSASISRKDERIHPRHESCRSTATREEDVADTPILHSDVSRKHPQQGQRQEPQPGDSCGPDNVADTKRKRQQGSRPQGNAIDTKAPREGKTVELVNGSVGGIWKPEPPVGRVAHGIPRRVDRLRGLGNAIVPQIAQRIGETIKQCEIRP